MPARTTDRPPPQASAAIVLLALLAALPHAAQADSATLFDTTRVLSHNGHECVGVSTCKPIKTRQQIIPTGQSQALTYNCPKHAPYFVGWDTEQSEHIQVSALPGTLSQAASTTGQPLIIAAENEGTAPGYVIVFLGCSTEPATPVAMMRHRSGIPSNHTTYLGGGN